MASVIPKQFKKTLTDAWAAEGVAGNLKVALLKSTYTWATTHDDYADVTGWEHAAGGGYTAGGKLVTGAVSGNTGEDAYLDIANCQWTSATLTNVRYAVLYNTVSLKIRAIYDLGGSYSVVSGTFTLNWDSDGVITVTS